MHIGRILALAGSVLAAFGLALSALIMDGVDQLPALSQTVEGVPDGVPTIFGGLDTWAKVVVVGLLIVIVILAVRPPITRPQDMISAGITALTGVVFLIYGVVKYLETRDDATALRAVFDQLDAAGVLPENLQASLVSAGFGFWIIILGAAVIAVGGVAGLITGRPQTSGA
jgi:hypothetical protein